MTQSDLLELAKQGHPQAIAALLARQFQPKGIAVQVTLHEDCLYLAIAAPRVPKQTTFSTYIRESFSKLAPEGIDRIEVSGYQQGNSQPSWHKVFSLISPHTPPTPPKRSSFSQKPLWLQWTIANLSGIFVFITLQHIFGFLGLISQLYGSITLGLFGGTLILAIVQSSFLDRRLLLKSWWLPATLGGLGVGAMANPILSPLFKVGVTIVASTLMQWWVLRKSLRQDLLWVWGNLGGLVAGAGIGSIIIKVLTIASSSGAIANWQLTVAIAGGFLAFSSIQGATMARLLQNPAALKRRKIPPRSRKDAGFATLWGFAVAFGFFLFITLAEMGGSGLDALLGHGFYGCVVGLVAGGVQFWLLQQKFRQSDRATTILGDRWIWATMTGYALFFGLSGLVGMNLDFFALFLAGGGAIVGTMQWWWVLRGRLPRSHWWIAAMSLGGLLTGWSRNGLSGGFVAVVMMLWLLQKRADLVTETRDSENRLKP